MRNIHDIAGGLLLVALVGCSTGVEVKTAVAPDASFTQARTFHFMRPPQRSGQDQQPQNSDDPMFENSIISRQVRENIAAALMQHGYTRVPGQADLSVAYYISAKRQLEVNNYNYGYEFWGWRGWRWGPRWGPWPDQQVTEFEQGTIIIDVLDGAGKQLLWRGVGKSDVPDDPNDYAKAVRTTVRAILARFPAQGSRPGA